LEVYFATLGHISDDIIDTGCSECIMPDETTRISVVEKKAVLSSVVCGLIDAL
jgi:hypothetical protein